MGKIAYEDTVNTNGAYAYRKCRDVFLNKLESQTLNIADFTDNGDATGYIDFDTDLPAGAIVVGWKAVVSTGFTGDTTAVMQVGVSGDLDKFSGITTASCLAAVTVGSLGNMATALSASDETPRVTVTGNADFSSISAGSMTVTLYYFLAS